MSETGKPRDRVLNVELELQLAHQPPRGLVRGGRGEEHAFVGWLGFVEALQRLDQSHLDIDPKPEEQR